MFEEFFQNCEILNPETVSEDSLNNIKSSLQNRLAEDSQSKLSTKEEKGMKIKTIRTIVIAAAAAVVGTIGIFGAASSLVTRERVMNDLAAQNSYNDAYYELIESESERLGVTVEHTPEYHEMNINKLFVTDEDISEWGYSTLSGIVLVHEEEGRGIGMSLDPDGNGGYLYRGQPIEDEKLLEAIEEGTKKYGDHFFIWY